MPFNRWQRAVARLLPWYDAEEATAHEKRTDRLIADVGRIESIRIAYTDAGNRMEKRKRAR